MDVELVVAIHPAFPWLVDWGALAIGGRRWLVVTTEASREQLLARVPAVRGVDVIAAPAFDPDTLQRTIAPRLSAAPGTLRFATMLEPMQLVVAELRGRYGAPGSTVEDLLPFTDKLVMKETLRGLGAYLPRYVAHDPQAFAAAPDVYVDAVIDRLGARVFAKPIAENSSLGTARLDSRAALLRFLRTSPHRLELDEFVEGDGYHLDSVAIGGEIVWFGAGQCVAPQGETLSGAPLAGISIAPGHALFREMEALNAAILAAFPRLPDGCIHLEMLRRPDGRWVFLEVAARVVGARCAEMHAVSRGVDMRQVHYQILAGLTPALGGRPGPHAGYYSPMKTAPGRIARFVAPPFRSPHTEEWFPEWRHRTDVARTMSMADCLGAFVLWNDHRPTLEQDLDGLRGFQPYVLDGSAS
jgi:hypothetical protein